MSNRIFQFFFTAYITVSVSRTKKREEGGGLLKNFQLLKVLMQGKLLQRCTHFLYCSVLSLGGKVNTRRISQPDMESIFTKIINKIFWSYTRRTLMHLFLFTNTAQRELVSICTQSRRNRN